MLHDGFAASKRSRNGGDSAARYGEQRVDDSLPRHHGRVGSEFLFIRSAPADGPFSEHAYGGVALFGLYDRDCLFYIEIALLYRQNFAAYTVGYEYSMFNQFGLRNRAQHVALFDLVTLFYGRHESPLFPAVEFVYRNTP